MSAPAIRADAHQRPAMGASQSIFALEIGANSSCSSFCDFLSINSRCGEGCADLP